MLPLRVLFYLITFCRFNLNFFHASILIFFMFIHQQFLCRFANYLSLEDPTIVDEESDKAPMIKFCHRAPLVWP